MQLSSVGTNFLLPGGRRHSWVFDDALLSAVSHGRRIYLSTPCNLSEINVWCPSQSTTFFFSRGRQRGAAHLICVFDLREHMRSLGKMSTKKSYTAGRR